MGTVEIGDRERTFFGGEAASPVCYAKTDDGMTETEQ